VSALVNSFPGKKHFAFSVFDDTDNATIHNVEPVYQLLAELGIYTTKSVWPLPCVPNVPSTGDTLADEQYLEFILWLSRQGFEIAFHNAQNHDATRQATAHGFAQFQQLIGARPRTHTNHCDNRENIYWGAKRLNSVSIRAAYNIATRLKWRNYFQGEVESSPYFWGDICKSHIDYVRGFVFDEVNLQRINPTMPYHDPRKPFVNYWFSSTDGHNADSFSRAVCEANQDRLETECGVCIMYTHFAAGFCDNGTVQSEFKRLMHRLATKNGWFVPVATLLDFLKDRNNNSVIPRQELANMERHWLLQKLARGLSGGASDDFPRANSGFQIAI